MHTTRIELDGPTGHLAIERQRGEATLRIDSIVRDPLPGQQTWKTWTLPATAGDNELFSLAIELQLRTNGCPGTNSDVQEFFRELQRFQD